MTIQGQYKPILMQNEDLLGVASKYGLPPTQIIVSWILQCGMSVIPKTTKPERMLENISVSGFITSTIPGAFMTWEPLKAYYPR